MKYIGGKRKMFKQFSNIEQQNLEKLFVPRKQHISFSGLEKKSIGLI